MNDIDWEPWADRATSGFREVTFRDLVATNKNTDEETIGEIWQVVFGALRNFDDKLFVSPIDEMFPDPSADQSGR
jgi:hypothetical protein